MATNNSINSTKPIGASSGGTGDATLTSHGVLVGNGTSAISALGVGTDGQVLVGASGAAPAFATLTSTRGTMTFTPGANSLSIQAPTFGLQSIATGSGTATQSGGSLTIAGGTNISTSGSGSTVTVSLKGSIALSNTNNTATTGMYSLSSNRFMHDFGTRGTFLGQTAGNLSLTATDCTAIGYLAGNALTSSFGLTAVGSQCFPVVAGGSGSNAGIGYLAGLKVTTGSSNTLVGESAGSNITTGSTNTCIGHLAGSSYSTANSSNIAIMNTGTSGDGNTTRIGASGSGTAQQNACFIAGIAGVTVASSATVLVNTSTDQLGTVASSLRYKENVFDLSSENIYKLRPVLFNYKKTNEQQVGLIAEEVAELFPSLVIYNTKGESYSVKYHDLPILLLNEIKKLHIRSEKLEELLNKKGVVNGNE